MSIHKLFSDATLFEKGYMDVKAFDFQKFPLNLLKIENFRFCSKN